MSHIKIKNVSVNNLKNISIDIPLETYVVFVGKSGSGKSTLVVNVIIEGYLKKNKNVIVPIEPLLFKQKSYIPYTNKTLSDYFSINSKSLLSYIESSNNSYSLPKDELINIVKILNLDKLNLKQKISELSLTSFNKCRFLYLLMNYANKLLIIDEIGAGLSFSECLEITKCFNILIKNGYSILSIEHAIPIITEAKYVIELGPGAGVNGGEIIFSGTINDYKKTKSWNNILSVLKEEPDNTKIKKSKSITITNINYRNFKDMNVEFPLNALVSICGMSSSGKTSLLDILYRACDKSASAWKNREGIDGEINGKNHIRRPYLINQTPLGNNSMSTPATYTGILESLRGIFLKSEENYKFNKSDFSYNANGKCHECLGKGGKEIIINDEEIFIECDVCNGKRYNKEVLSIKDCGISIGDALTISCEELFNIYSRDTKKKILTNKISFINNIGLSYIKLGQPSSTLSGGESQRIKITKELSKKLGDRCVFLLDSPAKGLHVTDLPLVLKSLKNLVKKNNSVIISENNPYFINHSDWIIFLEDGNIKYSGVPNKCPKELYNKLKWN